MTPFESRFGRWLYELLPALYRERDEPHSDPARHIVERHDLAAWLDACGSLLDALRATLDQRLADAFVDSATDNPDALACQDWLLPYFARLLDVNLVSPDAASRRGEVQHAIRWRQRKGTKVAAEEIVGAIVGRQSAQQEGWKRIAVTARVGEPLLPATAWGADEARFAHWRSRIVRHPGLPAVTVDLRISSQAVRAGAQAGLARRRGRLGGLDIDWQQAEPHGVPQQPGAFDDVSRRTVDLRRPGGDRGWANPRRLVVYTTIAHGRFAPAAVHFTAVDALQHSPYVDWSAVAGTPWSLTIVNRSDRELVLDADLDLGALVPADESDPQLSIEGVRIKCELSLPRGRLQLKRVVATSVRVTSVLPVVRESAALVATDSLFGDLAVPKAYTDLQRCTVRRAARCVALAASDTLFHGVVAGETSAPAPEAARFDHCRVPPELVATATVVLDSCCTDVAAFFASDADSGGPIGADAGVLRPDSPARLSSGASDGGEIGCYHLGRTDAPVKIHGSQSVTLSDGHAATMRSLVFDGTLTIAAGSTAPLTIERVALRSLVVETASLSAAAGDAPVLDARSSLFADLEVKHGLARLEYCTVLGVAKFARVQASECIFAGALSASVSTATSPSCIRYSSLATAAWPRNHCSPERPVFFNARFDDGLAGGAGCGVLHPACPASIRQGAEDGGEMGAFHEDRQVLRQVAVLDKLAEHLPVGIEPMLVADPRLDRLPAAR